jgi:hypothetical protein
MRFKQGWGVFYLTVLTGCGQDLVHRDGDPSVATPSSDEHPDVERSTNGAAYRLYIVPEEGRFELVPLAPPEYVSVFYTNFAQAPAGSGANTVSLHTSQTMSTYTNSNGVCFSAGGMGGPGCAALPAGSPCTNTRTACAIIQAVNNYANPLPDVIVQLANRATDTRNAIQSCGDNGGAFGQCAANAVDAFKVDSAFSSLTSAVGSGATGCSFCYNNASQLTLPDQEGLRDALLPGAEPTAMSTDTFLFVLQNDTAFGVDVITHYAQPFLDANVQLDDEGSVPGCATTGSTRVIATGGGLGPPAACTTTTCLASGAPATGYLLDFQRNGVGIIQPPQGGTVIWSDNRVSGVVTASAMAGGRYGVRVRTPFNTTGVTTNRDAFGLCNNVLAMNHFGVAVIGTPTSGSDFTFGVVAFDVNNTRVTNYAGTITVTLTPEGSFNFAGAPTYTFPATDRGGHTFTNGGHINATGMHTLSVTDNASPTPHTGSVTFNVR